MYYIVYIHHFGGQKGNFWLLFCIAVLTYHNSAKSIVGTDVLKCKSISSTQWHWMCPLCIPLSPRNIGHRWVQDLDEASYCGPTNIAFRVAHWDYWEKLYIISEFCSNEDTNDSELNTVLKLIKSYNTLYLWRRKTMSEIDVTQNMEMKLILGWKRKYWLNMQQAFIICM